jgi:hypothetical protein
VEAKAPDGTAVAQKAPAGPTLSIALSRDGNTLEVRGGTGKAGSAHVFTRSTGTWLATGRCERLQPRR